MPDNNPSQNRPASPQHAPDPATTYERAKPAKGAGKGGLDSPIGTATPTAEPNDMNTAATNAHPGDRQLNAHDDPGGTGGSGQPLNQINLSKPALKQPQRKS